MKNKSFSQSWWGTLRSNGGLATDLLVLANPKGLMLSHFLRVKQTYCLSLSTPSKAAKTHLGNRPLLYYLSRNPKLSTPEGVLKSRANLLIASIPRRCAGLFVNRQLSSAMWGPICIAPAFLGAKEVVARSHPSIKTEQRIMNHCIIGCVISEVGGDACG